MIVAGFGFRSGATLAALQDALARAGGPEGVTHLATLAAKAEGLAALGAWRWACRCVALDAGSLRGVADADAVGPGGGAVRHRLGRRSGGAGGGGAGRAVAGTAGGVGGRDGDGGDCGGAGVTLWRDGFQIERLARKPFVSPLRAKGAQPARVCAPRGEYLGKSKAKASAARGQHDRPFHRGRTGRAGPSDAAGAGSDRGLARLSLCRVAGARGRAVALPAGVHGS